jgi:hypothetical protein
MCTSHRRIAIGHKSQSESEWGRILKEASGANARTGARKNDAPLMVDMRSSLLRELSAEKGWSCCEIN